MSSMRYDNLLAMFGQHGCAVCNMIRHDVARYLDALLYEYVNEIPVYKAFRAGRGLCNPHYWQLIHTRRGSALGISRLSAVALDEILQIEAQSAPLKAGFAWLRGRTSALADALEPVGPCLACEKLNESEAMYVEMMAEHIHDSRLQEVYRQSEGLCLPHVRQVLRQMKNARDSEALLTIQRVIWERIKAELEEYIRKNQAENLGEPVGKEGDAWQRVISVMSGQRDIFGLRR